MKSYIIEGGRKLEGEVSVSGSKNASLPIMAACILNGGISKLYNVPNIHDIKMMIEILKNIGCKVKQNSGKIIVDSRNIKKAEIPENLMCKMRSSVIIAGAMLGRLKKAEFSYPGGCDIGARPIDLHLKAFKEMGVEIEENEGKIICKADEIRPAIINLDFPSVGATENIILTSIFSNGETVIYNAAMEPEIVDLVNFLNKMGAKISGAGTNEIRIEGVRKLKDVSYKIMPDRIEAGTLMCIVAATNGNIKLNNVRIEHLTPIIKKLEETGCKINAVNNAIFLSANKRLNAIDINTMPYPGFPTDMQSVFGAMLSTAKGTSIITENIFENRYKYVR